MSITIPHSLLLSNFNREQIAKILGTLNYFKLIGFIVTDWIFCVAAQGWVYLGTIVCFYTNTSEAHLMIVNLANQKRN